MRKFLFCLALCILLISFSSALGVSPARTTIDMAEGGIKRTVNVNIEGALEGKLSISVSGELADYVTLSSRFLEVKKGEKKTFSYDLEIPPSANLEPGLHKADIIILQEPEEESAETVQATLAVKTQIHVNVPLKGKYARARLYIDELEPGKVRFSIPVVSAGEYDLASVRANIDVINKLGNKVGSFSTKAVSIPSGQKKDLVYVWDSDVPVGEYLAKANVIYDGEIIELEQAFKIGEELVELQEIRVNNFRLGEIAKFEMLVENKWSEKVNDLYIDTKVFDSSKRVLSHFKSPADSIEALSKKVFFSYWDTAGFSEGSYDAEVTLFYNVDKSSKKNLVFEVSEDSIKIIGLGYVISEGSSGEVSILFIVVIGFGVVIIINILWFLWLRRKLKMKLKS